MAATPTMAEAAVSPHHSAEMKRSSYQSKPKDEGTERKETVSENTVVKKPKNITPEEPKEENRVKKKDPGVPKAKKEIAKKEDANPFTPSDAEARYICVTTWFVVKVGLQELRISKKITG